MGEHNNLRQKNWIVVFSLFFFSFLFFSFSFVSAYSINSLDTLKVVSAQENLGAFKINSCINLIQTCDNCSFINISSINYPDSSQALEEVTMQKSGTFYNYSFCDTSILGNYIVSGYGDNNGQISTWTYIFEIIPTSEKGSLLIIFVFLLAYGLLIAGILGKNISMTMFGSLITIFASFLGFQGIYTFKNTTTDVISFITLFFGAYWMLRASMAYLETGGD